jgi:1-acyl-sn-glycerol-3-phosphate acyltransferase
VFYWLLKYVVLGPLLRLLFRPDVQGLANVPATGPVILACNHLSFSDSIFTPLLVARRVTFVAKAEYFTGQGVKGRLMRRFFLATGTIPVDRSGGQAAQAALDTLLRVLGEGGIAGIYPEGTRSSDGRAGSRGDRFVERTITDEIMYELMVMTGRPYVDVYARKNGPAIDQPVKKQPSPPAAATPAGR